MIVEKILILNYALSLHLLINTNWKLWTSIKNFNNKTKKIINFRAKNSNYPKLIEYLREDRPSKSKTILNYPSSKPSHKQTLIKVLSRQQLANSMTSSPMLNVN
jgi:hypothetical protein